MRANIKYILYSMRPHQWIKNLIIFIPLMFGHRLWEPVALTKALITFVIFSAAASAMYMINDISDLKEDRKHPIKKLRPLAAGKNTAQQLTSAAFISGIGAAALSFILDIRIFLIILAYIILNLGYTLALKKIVIIDVFCLSAFYYLRILAGSISSDVSLSNWVVLCTVLLALFLGFNKRRYDVAVLKKKKVVYARYSVSFINCIIPIISSLTIISYIFYAMDWQARHRIRGGYLVYTTIPFVCYGIFRYLYLVDKKGFGGDPTRILLKDRKMQLNLALWVAVSIATIYFLDITH